MLVKLRNWATRNRRRVIAASACTIVFSIALIVKPFGMGTNEILVIFTIVSFVLVQFIPLK